MFEPDKRTYGLPAAQTNFVPAQPVQGYYPSQANIPFEEEEPFDPLKLLWFAVHYRWLIAAMVASALVIGVLVTWMQTPLYRATAQVEVLTSGAKVLEDIEVVQQGNDERAFETAKQKMLSRELARRVVFELNLQDDGKFIAPVASFSLFNFYNRLASTTAQEGLDDLSPEQRETKAVDILTDGLTVSLLRNTSILSLSFSHPDPEYAAKVANQLSASYIDQNVDRRSETSDLARQFIEQQVAETKQKLQASEQALVDYSKTAGITITGTDASLIAANINELNKALTDAVQDRLTAERFAQQVADGNASTLPEVFESDSIQSNKQKIAELKASYQEKLATLKPGFPEMRRLQAQIKELDKQVSIEVGAIARSIEIKYQQAKERETSLQRELSQLELRQADYQDKNIQYTILKREVDSSRTQYESLIGKLNEVGVGADLKTLNALVVDPAQIPRRAYSPRLSVNLALALALFGAITVAIIYISELLNNTFSVPDQIETELKTPVLGIIPFASDADILEAFKDSKSAISEAYRSLRTSLQFSGTEGSMRTLLVTSSEPSEGKSTTSFKLAQDFAALGRKVLIIDADLRRPRMHRMFNTDNSTGLSNLLSNVVRQGEVVSIFRGTQDPNVTFLSAGTIPPNPVDLLTSQKMAMTLHYCSKKFDLVIIDSPPVMGLSDAPILSRQVDATLLVVSAKQITRKAAKNAIARLRSSGGNVVGATLTKFQINKLDYNYAYRYMGYNYYAYNSETPRIEDAKSSGLPAMGKSTAVDLLRSVFRRRAT